MRCGHCQQDDVTVAHVRGCAKPATIVARVHEHRRSEPATAPKPVSAIRRALDSVETDLYAATSPDGERCRRCAGTGMFITMIENDVPKGPGGPCYRCAGKGRQSDCGPAAHAERAAAIAAGKRDTSACCDRVRNDLYDRFGIRIHL